MVGACEKEEAKNCEGIDFYAQKIPWFGICDFDEFSYYYSMVGRLTKIGRGRDLEEISYHLFCTNFGTTHFYISERFLAASRNRSAGTEERERNTMTM